MNNRISIVGLIAIGIISLLFFIIPITPAFIVSYIFTVIAIIILMKIVKNTNKKEDGIPQSYTSIYFAYGYVVISFIASLFAYIFISFSLLLPFVIHLAILGIFGIMYFFIDAGNEYISKLDNQEPTEERKKFIEEKKNYWK